MEKTRKKSKKSAKRIPFAVRADHAREVIVTGDFTAWREDGIRLEKEGDGLWTALLQLEPGEYQYRLRIDGEWRDHEQAVERVPNPYGSTNGVLKVL